ncbi:unnamed protein product [Alternaria alternata]
MSVTTSHLVLPRPGTTYTPKPPIRGPSESFFTSTFGALLPPAQHLETANGKAAYYSIPPSAPTESARTIDRVLLIHGVQTPAIGMLPLARALHDTFPHKHFVLVDLWGHGLSDTPVIPHEAALFHGLIDALLDHLQWSTAHLIGFSFGGSLTVGYTASRPSRVSSFTLVAPAGLIRICAFPTEDQHHLMHGVDEVEVRKLILRFLEGGELIVPDDWRERVGRGEIVPQAVKEWQMREHPGHTASVVAMFRDGGAMYNHDNFEKAVRTGIPSLVVLGGEKLRAHLAEFNAIAKAAASTDLQNLHLAIGAQYLRFLPKFDDIRYDETTDVGEYLPIMVQVGTYNAPAKPKKKSLKTEQVLEVWAYHTLSQKPTEEDPAPISLIELVAFNMDQQHVPNLPGLEIDDPWATKKQLVDLLPPFVGIRDETELRCLVRYCLLLAAAENHFYFDGLSISREPGFTGVLVELCKREWEDERFQALEKTGVLSDKSNLWDGVPKLDVQKGRDAEQYSMSESEGEDRIPAVIPEGTTQHLRKKSRRRRRRDS